MVGRDEAVANRLCEELAELKEHSLAVCISSNDVGAKLHTQFAR